MKLHEFHIAESGPRAVCGSEAVAGGNLWIGGFAVDLASATGAENGLLGPDECFAVLSVPDEGAATRAVVGEQIEREGILPGFDVGQLRGAVDDCPHHF